MKSTLCKVAPAVFVAGTAGHLCLGQRTSAPQAGYPSGTRFESHTFVSQALQRSMPYEVLLPLAYDTSSQRYPVLYLLHGWHGDETSYRKLTALKDVAARYPILVIMPRGDDSWYVNSSTTPRDRYGDYIFGDLIHDVDSHYRTIASAQGRAIAGLSMGGYGAVLFSLQHPGAFRFVASLSGAFAGPSGIEKVMPGLKPSTDAAFGGPSSEARKRSDLDALLASDAPADQPYFYLACGSSDPLLLSNRHVVEELSARKFAYEYHELPGAHAWTFWSGELEPMLAALAKEMHLVLPVSPEIPSPAASIP